MAQKAKLTLSTPVLRQSDLDDFVVGSLYPSYPLICFYFFCAIDCDGLDARIFLAIEAGYCGVANRIATSAFDPWIQTVVDRDVTSIFGFDHVDFDFDFETSCQCGTASFSTRSFSANATCSFSWTAARPIYCPHPFLASLIVIETYFSRSYRSSFPLPSVALIVIEMFFSCSSRSRFPRTLR